jgi:MoaA/NifB/PqqE/SkfB family radical SAM enzyme
VIKEKLSIELTTQCNINCSFCFARAGNAERFSLSTDLVKAIIAEGYNTGYRRLHITGGEPLLWEGLFEILDYAFGMGYKTTFMNTNGTLLTDSASARLAVYGGLSISVSLDGQEALHEYLRGKGSYRRVIQGIENSLNAGNNLFIFTLACKSILPDLPQFVNQIYKQFSSIKCLTLIPLIKLQDGVFPLSKQLLEPDDFLQLVRTVALLNVGGFKTDVLNDPMVNVASKFLEMPWIPPTYPLYRDGSMIIMANRDIRLSHSSDYIFAKYKSGMIEKVLTSDEYKRAVSPDEATCPSCEYKELCKENGVVRPSDSFREMRSEVPYCRQILDRIAP